MKSVLIVIPARYESTRFPGKPFAKIKGVEMLLRVARIADFVCRHTASESIDCRYVVATDSDKIVNQCEAWKVPVVMTSEACKNGTERCWDTLLKRKEQPDLIINLQGDNPLCPPHFVSSLITAWMQDTAGESGVFTPCIQLSWKDLDELKKSKLTSPFSGTTVMTDRRDFAMIFSKTIIPTIRKAEKLQEKQALSPVKRHIGLYAYTYAALEAFQQLPQGEYESNDIEGLEQLRFLENNVKIKMVYVEAQGMALSTSGVDSPEDVVGVEQKIDEFGEYQL